MMDLGNGGWVGPILLLVVAGSFWIYCLADVAQAEDWEVRLYPRDVWLLIVLFGNVFGGLYWLMAGRRRDRR